MTYGFVGLLAVSGFAHLEPWPVSSMRLFSELRTGQRQALVLTAVASDGHRDRVRLDATVEQTRTAQRQLPDLLGLSPAARRRAALAWLEAAGLDPDRYDAVILQRTTYRLDPDGGPSTELERQDLILIPLR